MRGRRICRIGGVIRHEEALGWCAISSWWWAEGRRVAPRCSGGWSRHQRGSILIFGFPTISFLYDFQVSSNVRSTAQWYLAVQSYDILSVFITVWHRTSLSCTRYKWSGTVQDLRYVNIPASQSGYVKCVLLNILNFPLILKNVQPLFSPAPYISSCVFLSILQ